MAKQERKIGGVAARETWITPAARALQVDEPESLKRLKAKMAPVNFKMAIAGTERGAGVSTVAVNLALALTQADREGHDGGLQENPKIGILDLGVRSKPALDPAGVRVLSLETLLGSPRAQQSEVRTDWRGVQESLTRVDWRGLDLLLVELPFGIETVGDLSEVFPVMDAACIVTLPTERARDRIRRIWKFLDDSSIPAIGLVSNMEGRFKGEDVEDLGQIFGIPLRLALPYEPGLTAVQPGAAPYILANKEATASRAVLDFSDDLVDYLYWLRDEHEQEEEF